RVLREEAERGRLMQRHHALMGAVLAMVAGAGWGATVVVGPASCSAAQSHPFYSTIQGAINSVPAGSTVLVCPGTYPEQVSIAKNLTLKGVVDTNASGKANQAVIAIPSGTLATIPEGGGYLFAPQIAVTDGATASISDLTIDG